jgi:hypothetical protein
MNLQVIQEQFWLDFFAVFGVCDNLFDVVEAAGELSEKILGYDILGEFNSNIFHLDDGASYFGYELLCC